MIIFQGPIAQQEKASELRRKSSIFSIVFYSVWILLPIIIFSMYSFSIVKPSNGISISNEGLISSVPMVVTSSGTGSAFLVGKSTLISARHVFDGYAEGTYVDLDFQKADPPFQTKAQIIFLPDDNSDDYAVLRTDEELNDLIPFKVGDSDLIKITDKIRVIGYPGGLFSSAPGEITNDNFPNNVDLMQLYAGAWPGNSGGPVIDQNTENVIGILSGGFEDQYKGIIVSVKINSLINDPNFKTKVGSWSK